jgi:hypothetical protein
MFNLFTISLDFSRWKKGEKILLDIAGFLEAEIFCIFVRICWIL